MILGFPGGSEGKASACNVGDPGLIPGWQRSPGAKEMATHSSILAWRIPWTEQPGRLQPTGSKRVGHNWATSLHFNICMIWEIFIKFKVVSSHHIVLFFYRMPIKIQLFSMYWEEGEKKTYVLSHIYSHTHPSPRNIILGRKKNPWSNVAVCDETFRLTTLSSRESFKLPH